MTRITLRRVVRALAGIACAEVHPALAGGIFIRGVTHPIGGIGSLSPAPDVVVHMRREDRVLRVLDEVAVIWLADLALVRDIAAIAPAVNRAGGVPTRSFVIALAHRARG